MRRVFFPPPIGPGRPREPLFVPVFSSRDTGAGRHKPRHERSFHGSSPPLRKGTHENPAKLPVPRQGPHIANQGIIIGGPPAEVQFISILPPKRGPRSPRRLLFCLLEIGRGALCFSAS